MSVCEDSMGSKELKNNSEGESAHKIDESASSTEATKPHVLPTIKFSIDNILSRVSPKRNEQKSEQQQEHGHSSATRSDTDVSEDIDVNDGDVDDDGGDVSGCDDIALTSSVSEQLEGESVDEERYSWLHCTRYKPPKLPRSKRKDSSRKRKLGRNPRVPFTQHQVSVLENKFCQTHYLSSVDVAELSAALNLTETRVKIWFQNRRARERRDKTSPADLMKVHNSSPPFSDKQASHLHNTSFPTLRMPSAEEQSLCSSGNGNPLHSMLQSHWGYYQALQGLYGYRPLATHSLQYYDVARRAQMPRIVALRQSAFTAVGTDDGEPGMAHT